MLVRLRKGLYTLNNASIRYVWQILVRAHVFLRRFIDQFLENHFEVYKFLYSGSPTLIAAEVKGIDRTCAW